MTTTKHKNRHKTKTEKGHPPDNWAITVAYIAGRKRLEESLGFLAEVSRVLVSTSGQRSNTAEILQLCVPFLSDWCGVIELEDETVPATWAMASIPGISPSLLAELKQYAHVGATRFHTHLNSDRTERKRNLSKVSDQAQQDIKRHNQSRFTELGISSIHFVPLFYQDVFHGLFCTATMRDGQNRLYDQSDLALCEEIGRRIASVIKLDQLSRRVEQLQVAIQ